mmetsp:Transcript_14036/g.41176  ORF Transcript_14036/g.41176 Transcript_14036/m.41176 type:complete len:293 (-) Transcript_14036:12-890(-)
MRCGQGGGGGHRLHRRRGLGARDLLVRGRIRVVGRCLCPLASWLARRQRSDSCGAPLWCAWLRGRPTLFVNRPIVPLGRNVTFDKSARSCGPRGLPALSHPPQRPQRGGVGRLLRRGARVLQIARCVRPLVAGGRGCGWSSLGRLIPAAARHLGPQGGCSGRRSARRCGGRLGRGGGDGGRAPPCGGALARSELARDALESGCVRGGARGGAVRSLRRLERQRERGICRHLVGLCRADGSRRHPARAGKRGGGAKREGPGAMRTGRERHGARSEHRSVPSQVEAESHEIAMS